MLPKLVNVLVKLSNYRVDEDGIFKFSIRYIVKFYMDGLVDLLQFETVDGLQLSAMMMMRVTI